MPDRKKVWLDKTAYDTAMSFFGYDLENGTAYEKGIALRIAWVMANKIQIAWETDYED